MEDYQKYLDPKVLNKIGNLELKARLIVEGYISGLHKSPYHGFSVEFAQHREYVPGDDIRHIDWKVYGKSDRYYIKQYEEETNLISYFVLDSSASMRYKSGDMNKYDYACHIVAGLSYLALQQQDATGLVVFDQQINKVLPASSNPAHLKDVAYTLSQIPPANKTSIVPVLHDVSERLRKRGLVIILSDFFDDVDAILEGLMPFRHRKHDVILFHLLDPYELQFPIQQMTMFDGMEETNLKILANPRALRNAYLKEINSFVRELKSGCMANRIDYVQITTDQHLDVALSAYLSNRAGQTRF